MIPQPVFNVQQRDYDRRMAEFQAVTGMGFLDVIRYQGKLLIHEIIQRTPPLSGKSIVRILDSQGKQLTFRNAEIQDMTARAVGVRRVRRDIARIIYGVKGAALRNAQSRAQSMAQWQQDKKIGFGVLQKCEGRLAVRIFATKKGVVYGVDTEEFKPDATLSDLAAAHKAARNSRGRVTMAGAKTRDVGRWKWINVLVTRQATANRYTRQREGMVGQGKGGWASGANHLGMNISTSGWYGRHFRAGTYIDNLKPGSKTPSFTFINKSAWASGGDDQRIIENSMRGRAVAMEKHIERMISDEWRHIQRKAA